MTGTACSFFHMPDLGPFITTERLDRLIATTIEEDLGPDRRDLTSELTIPADAAGTARFNARTLGVACGLALLPPLARAFDERLTIEVHAADGHTVTPRQTLATVTGPLRAILALERTALNFLCHLSGIATLTAEYVVALDGLRAKVYDTRKTIPGLRGLAKYAVACGGGMNHRIGLYDAVLVKDNHLAHTGMERLGKVLGDAKPQASFVEVECDTIAQVERALALPVDLVLLDNMTPEVLREAVKLRDRVAPRVELEASGGVTLETVRAIAETGVDRVAVGALTHSAPALDIGLDIDGNA